VRIVETFTMAINMAFGVAVEQRAHPDVMFKKVNNRFYVFIPAAAQFDAKVYVLQRKEIDVRM